MSVFECNGSYNPQKERRRRASTAVGITLAVATGIGGAGLFVKDKLANANVDLDSLINTNVTLSQDACPPVDQSTLQVVQTIFDTKDPKELKDVSPATPNKYDKYVRLQAKRFGVTLSDPNLAYDKLVEAQTVDDVLGGFNDFLQEFGYTATIPTQRDEHDDYANVELLPPEDVDFKNFAIGTYLAIQALQYLPVEVARLASDVEIRFVKSIGRYEDEAMPMAIGLAISNPNRIYVDMEAFYDGTNDFVLPHEIGHHIDAAFCGEIGYRNDTDYSTLNPDNFTYLGDNYLSVLDKDVEDVTASRYGASNIVEDKAVVMEETLTEAEGFGEMSPVLRSKFELIIARIEQHAPRYAGYLRAISSRHDK